MHLSEQLFCIRIVDMYRSRQVFGAVAEEFSFGVHIDNNQLESYSKFCFAIFLLFSFLELVSLVSLWSYKESEQRVCEDKEKSR